MGVFSRLKEKYEDRAAEPVSNPNAPYLIVGLGNPDKKYAGTRHNTGYDVLDVLAKEWNIPVKQLKLRSMVGTGMINGKKVVLMKPVTYMNRSGEAVGQALNFYKADPATHLIVIYDDIALAVGQLRVRTKGSAGGHNGIKNIISHLSGSEEFLRVRVGVGEKPEQYDQVDWVLGHFDKVDEKIMEDARARAAEAAAALLTDDVNDVMSRFNRKE